MAVRLSALRVGPPLLPGRFLLLRLQFGSRAVYSPQTASNKQNRYLPIQLDSNRGWDPSSGGYNVKFSYPLVVVRFHAILSTEGDYIALNEKWYNDC
jgi:hypothetical protein